MNAKWIISSLRALALVLACLVGLCSAQASGARAQRLVRAYADDGWFMGSVLIAQNGKVVLSKGYGWADAEWSIPNSPSTRFAIASITKEFTAASILLLEERGKLKTADLVKKYLPEAPASWDKITIYNLLTHTSGIPDAGVEYESGPPEKTLFRDKPLEFQPGEKWSYSNQGYVVLGYVLESLSGQTYEDFVHDNIFKPLGMNDSGMDSNFTVIPRRASGYSPGENGIDNAERIYHSAFAAGGIYSTTEDMLRWEEGLFGGKLLTPVSLHKMTTPFKSDWACGLYVKHVNGHLMAEQSGGAIGFNADVAYYPEEKLAVIVLGNLNTAAILKMTAALADVMHGDPISVSIPKAIALPREILARYVGTYTFSDGDFVVTLHGDHLIADYGSKYRLFPESETKFFIKWWDMNFEFSKNEKGEFTTVTQHFDGKADKGQKK
jgi:CubicO group peptidase (beta-lactamase class C family)